MTAFPHYKPGITRYSRARIKFFAHY